MLISLTVAGSFHLAFPLGRGGHHVHLFDCHCFWVLLHHHGSEFRCQSGLEQVHLEEVKHHTRILSLECPEGLVGDPMIDVVVWIRVMAP